MSGVRIRNGRENTKIVPDVERVLEGTIYKRYCGRDYRGNHCIAIVDCVSTGIRREPEQGIYTAIVAGFVIAMLGGSRVQISGPTAAFATIVAGIVAQKGMAGLVAATILAGVILILMGVFKLGGLIKFIPYTIVTGFTSGIAVTIVIGQIKTFWDWNLNMLRLRRWKN